MEAEGRYARLCRASYRALSALVNRERIDGYSSRYASRGLVASIGFAGLEVKPSEVFSLAFFSAMGALALVSTVGLIALALGLMDSAMAIMLIACGGIAPLLTYVYVGEYPKRRAAYMRVHSLGDVPDVISYIVMAMKLNPNIELALKFAASNSKRQLAKDVKKLMWDLQMRAYDSLDMALGAFASEWGGYSEHFKRAVFLIKSATEEREEAMRTIALNRALDVVLQGTKSLMQSFSSALHSPTLILYSIFVMVPLALVAMLPAAAIVGMRVNAIELALLYDLLFPLATLVYAHSILMRRPAAFTPADIPNVKQAIPAWAWAALALSSGAAISALYFFPLSLPIARSAFPVWGVTVAISVYCLGVYTPYKKLRDDIKKMEDEFADSLFILGRRVSEGRSPEESFAYTAAMTSGTSVGKAYARAAYNIRCLRTTLRDAVLSPEYGAFSDVYSDRIKATISMLVESSGKSGEIAGNSIVRLADHLKELQSIEDDIRKMLYTMTSMLKTTCMVFSPFIGGVTLALSQSISDVVAHTLASLSDMPESARQYFPMVPEFSAPMVSNDQFVLIIGLYLVMLVIILLRFVSGIEHGDDRYEFMYSVGTALPIAMAIFTVTTALAGSAFGSLI
ncbi:hypothetical protein [Methanocella conradii]|uniref:hypothetical protein n=1 Tax=Methanocella conradii TaxID=1175444 RepID=UPI00157C2CD9|nr:hypothetical protein [Methanocella conradii]